MVAKISFTGRARGIWRWSPNLQMTPLERVANTLEQWFPVGCSMKQGQMEL